ncbi:MAG TPA: hypothetical protein VIG90_01875 [Pedomonas sp.]|uniref:hypothetical protein n=1 Tax=Pedomonas sp. TaxID=2976421 RepID=UPI002F424372
MAAQEASGGGGGVISAKEYVDVKVDGVRSDLQASIADLRAEVRGLAAKIEALPTTWTLVGTIAGGFAVSLGLIFTFRSYSNDNAEHVRARQQQLDKSHYGIAPECPFDRAELASDFGAVWQDGSPLCRHGTAAIRQ